MALEEWKKSFTKGIKDEQYEQYGKIEWCR